MWKGSGRAWQERRYLEKRQRARCAKQPQDSLREKHPPPEPPVASLSDSPTLTPSGQRGCHLAEELKGLEDPFFPDLRISEMATCSGRRM